MGEIPHAPSKCFEIGLRGRVADVTGMGDEILVTHRVNVGAQPGDDVELVHVVQGRGFGADPEDHQRQEVVDAEPALLQLLDIAFEFVRQEETGAGKHPVVGIAVKQDLARAGELDRRGVGEKQMAEAHEIAARVERRQMLLEVRPLDELGAILLLDGHKHAQDIVQQVASALGDAVEEQRLSKRRRREPRRVLVERVGFYSYGRHGVVSASRIHKKRGGMEMPPRNVVVIESRTSC